MQTYNQLADEQKGQEIELTMSLHCVGHLLRCLNVALCVISLNTVH